MSAPVRLVGLEVGDEPAAWRAAGFHLDGDELHVGGVVLRLGGAHPPRGLRGWALDPPTDAFVDGLAPLAPPPTAPDARGTAAPHPNGVSALDHVVVTTDDVERTTSALAAVGVEPRRTVVGARGDGDDDVLYRFFLLGTCVVELVGPAGSRADAAQAAGPGRARLAGLAFTTEAIDDLGELAGAPRDAVQPGRRIATLRTEQLGISVPVALLTPRPPRRAR